jgi:hypothetical protein
MLRFAGAHGECARPPELRGAGRGGTLAVPARRTTMKLSELADDERRSLVELEARIGRAHLRHRLALEGENEARVFRRGTHVPHLENWISLRALLRGALRMAGLHGRAQRNALRIELRRNEVAVRGLPAAFDGCAVLAIGMPPTAASR